MSERIKLILAQALSVPARQTRRYSIITVPLGYS